MLLRVRGWTAALMTVTLVNLSVGGALVGGEAWLPAIVGQPVAFFGWLITPIGFPVVGLTVLMFPAPSPLPARTKGPG